MLNCRRIIMKKENINLFNCSKDDIRRYIKFLLRTISHDVYVGLKDKYTDNAWFWTSTNEDMKHKSFFEINSGIYSYKELRENESFPELYVPDDGGQHKVNLDDLVESLYSYILETYR